MHLPPTPNWAAFDEMCGGELAELVVGNCLGLVGESGGCGRRDVGTGIERQHAEQILLLWEQAVEGLVEDGAQVAFSVVDAVQPSLA
ncbi:hypothetical protein San01_12080 [Streptomyces angustmyceticus]|uniref:Uncharacterized protein n=1 Tax=Streptomyces angustmyceticus TaxID=285578 RepID=A0A5J4LA80_9ACTN|nr:hypothetical protein San01_12080 [Streptomyces angustmyceticus]